MKLVYIVLSIIVMGVTTPALADDSYTPPDNGHPDGTRGSTSRATNDCSYKGVGDRSKECVKSM